MSSSSIKDQVGTTKKDEVKEDLLQIWSGPRSPGSLAARGEIRGGNTNLQRSWGVITDHYMSFKNFRSIMNGVYTSNYPIDLLGYLDGVGEIEVVTDHTFTLGDNMQTSRVTFTIKDLEGRTLECEARGVLAIQLYNKWWRHGGTETFITMSDWMVYTDRGTNEMKIKDAGGISRFEFNALYQDVYEFRAAYFNESDPTRIESDGSSVELDWSP
ncbi:unnamed protein product [Microthlaspi erraticum]|uniref:DUF223 domain-containing protein n=1 Tax=Microthlaspi erraticum TaxID=1685480 RepID=A0A6D2JTM8_9BRAS|nr:unnamed protein product [Microthlaspi erraticum]